MEKEKYTFPIAGMTRPTTSGLQNIACLTLQFEKPMTIAPTQSYRRGSEWRKWDLHLHSPGTKKNDCFRVGSGDVWTEYCKRLEESDVQAFGITDYFSADGYFNTVEKFRAAYPNSKKTFFANVELCTNDVVNKLREEVNLHVVFNPKVADEKIREFLRHLCTNTTDSSGRNEKASELKIEADYEAATTTRVFINDALKSTFATRLS